MFTKKKQKYIKLCNNENTIINFINSIIKSLLLIFFILHRHFPFIQKIYIYKNELIFYKNYILDCKKLKKINSQEKIRINHPYFSIIIPVYNSEKYIENALFSTINQSFQNFEIIIINDYTNDKTTSIIQNFQSKFNNIKIINLLF